VSAHQPDFSTIDPAALRARADALQWFHTMDLGHGVVTRGVIDCELRLRALQLPPLTGKSVLDIGAWDGFFSFAAERRGAARVLATDSFSWSGRGWGSRAGFELARRAYGSRVEDLEIDVMDLAPERLGRFDVVLFLGVLYHLRHPLLALERVAAVTGERLILETVVDLAGIRRPAMAFYPGRELNDDPTNWWAPNLPGLRAMLHAVGFTRVDVVSPVRSAPYRAMRAAYHGLTGRNALRLAYRRDRAVVHALR
jgi:tRNA (mo5U34)-methyltransferase